MPSNRKLPLDEAELPAFEATRDIAAEIVQAVQEMKAGLAQVAFSPTAEARRKTGLSQAHFAELIGVSVRTLRDWERGRRHPSGPALALLAIARSHPEAVLALAAK